MHQFWSYSQCRFCYILKSGWCKMHSEGIMFYIFPWWNDISCYNSWIFILLLMYFCILMYKSITVILLRVIVYSVNTGYEVEVDLWDRTSCTHTFTLRGNLSFYLSVSPLLSFSLTSTTFLFVYILLHRVSWNIQH